ncbi:MAG: ABC transporter permease subunit [Prochloraceae cyanobacterium]|nr:ABC transporter permease subunit [Prochloraceae cyanobacterium]
MEKKIPFWRNDRVRRIGLQGLVILLVAGVLFLLGNNLVSNLQQKGLSFGFDFLKSTASFDIGDRIIEYSRSDPYIKAVWVGLLNSLRIMSIGIVLATILGITVGIGKLSDNWLVRQIATVYVEIIRNTPLLLQLFFWYYTVFLQLPRIDNPIVILGNIYLSNKGMNIPLPAGTTQTWLSLGFIALSVILAIIIWGRINEAIERQLPRAKILQILLVGIAIANILAVVWGLDWRVPQFLQEENLIEGGANLSTEYATLLIGLVVYTAAFIAEVVRAGIQSVNIGQREAANALGLSPSLTMRLVIFPQALRLMIPPLTSEYLNLAKNSSLAIAIGYYDVYAVSFTISNQTGRSVEMLLVVMGTYLIISLTISLIMNSLNQRFKLKER